MASPGLSTAEAEQRLQEVGPNAVRQRGRVSVWSSIGVQLRDPLIVVLLAACALTIAIGDLTDTAVIAVVVVVNTSVGVFEEVRADSAISALSELAAPSVRVRRDGVEVALHSSQLVPGDLVVLGEGDIVPADGDLMEASSLLIDESALTGESVAVGKSVGDDADRTTRTLSSGTVVVKGRALAAVTRTGASSALGQIASLLDTRVQTTPLQQRLAGLGRVLALTAIALCGLVLVLGVARGQPLELMAVTAISLAVAAVPESLPAVVTLSLALGARRMANRHAVVRRLPAVETLGSVTVLATDKTGTLTQATMVVKELWTPQHDVTVSGDSATASGRLVSSGAELDLAAAPDVLDLLRACVLCNDAALTATEGADASGAGLGDPTELALLGVGAKAGLGREQLQVEFPRVGEVPFDSVAQQMTTLHERGDGGLWVISKGSVEALHRRHGQGRDAAAWNPLLDRAGELAERGFRVLAVTAAPADASSWKDAEQRLLGMVALADPVKPAAESTIAQCRRAGILPVLITGDHPATALSVAQQVGILDADEAERQDAVATGAQILSGQVEDLTAVRVFARTSPEQKLDIVQAWKDRGDVVAMTGDGVNDGPALHRADIGVAMGHRGTEVARQSADLVLADDELETVVAAVEEGRRIYANIRLFLVFGLSGGAAEILVMLIGPGIGLSVPLLAAQILWINLLTHGLTGVALGAEPAGPDIMHGPPRPPGQSVLGDGHWQRVLAVAAVLCLATLGLGYWAHDTEAEWQSITFVALVSGQLGVLLGLRPRQLTHENPLLLVAVAASFLLAVAGVYLAVFQSFLGTVPLPYDDLTVALGAVVVGWGAARSTRPRRSREATVSSR